MKVAQLDYGNCWGSLYNMRVGLISYKTQKRNELGSGFSLNFFKLNYLFDGKRIEMFFF